VKRLHLFEWEDMPWLPRVLRRYAADFLRYSQSGSDREETNRLMADKLAGLLARSGQHRIVDLGSGGGGPILEIAKHLERKDGAAVEIVLTDLYPQLEDIDAIESASRGAVRFERAPVIATDVPAELGGVRTMFNAFHHFAPADARRVLEDAVRKRAPLASFELLTRNAVVIAIAPLAIFLRALVITPRIGRMTIARFLLTYLLPAAPFIAAWDGTVSCMRMYTVEELRELARGLDGAYTWEAGEIVLSSRTLPPITYLVGVPAPE
jgi:SAM-dependent methyltransferase